MKKSTIILTVILVVVVSLLGAMLYMISQVDSTMTEQPAETESVELETETVPIETCEHEDLSDAVVYTSGAVKFYADEAMTMLIGTIDSGTEVQLVSTSEDGWSLIDYNDGEVYVLSECLSNSMDFFDNFSPTESNEPQFTTDEYGNTYAVVYEKVSATGNVHIRSGPSVRYAKLGILPCNGTIIRTGIGENGWSQVLYQGKPAYITTYYLSTTGLATYTEVEETVYAIKNANIRKGPTINYELIGVLNKDASITRIGIGDNGWSKVLYNGKEAFMYSLYLTTDIASENEESEKNAEATMEPVDDGAIIEPSGELCESIVYEHVSETVYAIADANIRLGPGVECDLLNVLAAGESISRAGIGDNGWSLVVYNGKEAFIYSEYLTTENPNGE